MSNENRDENGKFKKGYSGNPNGRPKVPKDKELLEAIAKVEQEKGKPLVEHFVERAYESDSVLAVIYKKILPDKKAIETQIYDDRREEAIRNEKERIDAQIATGKALDDAPDAMAT